MNTDRTPVRYFHFHTVVDGRTHPYAILGTSVTDAVRSLRLALYDGETIVGWN